ncbi:MAG TPA: YqgE/AlgH family protein [Rhodothermales bacterium]|nr:YqgE/AlgH family protein [Rhodothermales bacterium]
MSYFDDTVRPGTLLIAPPLSDDPNFKRAVVLVCEHNEQGSFGLVLNRGLTLRLADVLEEVDGYAAPLSLGGPVQQNTLHVLHRFGALIPDAMLIAGDVYWGGEFDAIKSLIGAGRYDATDIRFFLGYSGWSGGQLAQEVEHGGWILADADAASVFPDDQDKLWRTVLRKMGGDYAVLANFPDDPRLN